MYIRTRLLPYRPALSVPQLYSERASQELESFGGAIGLSVSKLANDGRGAGVRMEESNFQYCRAHGEGGSVAIVGRPNEVPMENVIMEAKRCLFHQSEALRDTRDSAGGTLLIAASEGYLSPQEEQLALRNSSIDISNSTFSDCHAASSGGAVAAKAILFYFNSFNFQDNTFSALSALVTGPAVDCYPVLFEVSTTYMFRRNRFEHLHAGAIVIGSFKNVTGHLLLMEDNVFQNISREVAVYVYASDLFSNISVIVKGGEFNECHNNGVGGVLSVYTLRTMASVFVSLTDCTITHASANMGGAFSLTALSGSDLEVNLANISSYNTTAMSSGGFASMLVAKLSGRSIFSASYLMLRHSRAGGQGGAFYFDSNAGVFNPIPQTLTPNCTCKTSFELPTQLFKNLPRVHLSEIRAVDVQATDRGMGGLVFGVNSDVFMYDVTGSVDAGISGAFVYTSGWSSLYVSSSALTASPRLGSMIQHEGRGSIAINSSSFAIRGDKNISSCSLLQVAQAHSLDIHSTEFRCPTYYVLRQINNASSDIMHFWPLEHQERPECSFQHGTTSSCLGAVRLPIPFEKLHVMCEVCPPKKYTVHPGRINDGEYYNTECDDCPFAAFCPGDSLPRAPPGVVV